MTLDELKTECALRAKTYHGLSEQLPDEKLRISARSARDCYREIGNLLGQLSPDPELLAIFVDAAGGTIRVKKEHVLQARTGGVSSFTDLATQDIVYERTFEDDVVPVGPIVPLKLDS